MSTTERIQKRNAAWFPRYKPAHEVYCEQIRSLLTPESVSVHLGAGRDSLGVVAELRDGGGRIVSVDLDGHGLAQNSNPWCVQASGVSLPLRSQSVDLVVTDNVFEHLDEPLEMLAECRRVLKDGGAIVFLCPNGYGYIALISRLTPHWVHAMFKRRALGVADEDTFPTYYRLNSKRAITRLAGQTGFEVNTLQSFVGWPTYWEFSEGLHRVFVLVHALLEKLPLWSHVSLVGVLRTKARRAPDRGEQ